MSQELQSLTIDFAKNPSEDFYYIEGCNEYDRVYIKNANGHTVCFRQGATLHTRRGVLVMDTKARGLRIESEKTKGFLTGGISVLGDMPYLLIDNMELSDGEFGLHMPQHNGEEIYKVIEVTNCLIRNVSREGIYIGKSDRDEWPPSIESFTIQNTTIFGCGWDGLQFAGCNIAKIENCHIYSNGIEDVKWQNFDITVNPENDLVYFFNTKLNKTQILNSGKIFIN